MLSYDLGLRVEVRFRFKVEAFLSLMCKLEASVFLCGKRDYNPSTLFLMFIMFLKVLIVFL